MLLNKEPLHVIPPKCVAAIEGCLVAAYRLARDLHDNRESHYARISYTELAISTIHEECDNYSSQFSAEKIKNRAMLKQGLLSKSDYAAFLNSGRERLDALQDRIRAIKRGVFSGYTGLRIPYGREE